MKDRKKEKENERRERMGDFRIKGREAVGRERWQKGRLCASTVTSYNSYAGAYRLYVLVFTAKQKEKNHACNKKYKKQ
jgi:hypothetical protein